MTGAGTGLGTVTYSLNGLGQRYSKTLSGTTTIFLYDQAGHLIAETSDGGTSYTEYLWLGDTPVALIKPGSAALYYIHTDHLDTPRLIANQTPATVWRWDNDDPFGGNMANENPSGLGAFEFNLRFPGQYFDKETNQHYNYFRDYSPEIGRSIESDPIGMVGGLNTYGYVKSDPLSRKDPKGLLDPFSEVPAEIATLSGGIVASTFDPNAIFPTRELSPYPVIRCEDGVLQACVFNDPTTLPGAANDIAACLQGRTLLACLPATLSCIAIGTCIGNQCVISSDAR
ncbi:MAG: RHS repeat-associated core domain-containing protein [Gammaproteobacteria bacterium]|nr:RHS repeat-associated core domain-containing protein [Gammaproteobacteria bacterium]